MKQDRGHTPAFLFDLDGTLIDSVYQHVLAWHEALEEMGLSLAVWRIHRRIGMSGGLLVQALGREIGQRITSEQAQELQKRHAAAYERYQGAIQPLPGARDLLQQLSRTGVPYAIATSGRPEGARQARSRSVSGGGRATQCACRESHGCRRQCVGPAGGSKSRLFRRRPAFGRLWKRRTGAGRRLSCLPGSGRLTKSPR